jgi:hypothetical protein
MKFCSLHTLTIGTTTVLYTVQEVALAVLAHAGAGASHEIDCALAVLSGTFQTLNKLC